MSPMRRHLRKHMRRNPGFVDALPWIVGGLLGAGALYVGYQAVQNQAQPTGTDTTPTTPAAPVDNTATDITAGTTAATNLATTASSLFG
jgi:hypothetical protein